MLAEMVSWLKKKNWKETGLWYNLPFSLLGREQGLEDWMDIAKQQFQLASSNVWSKHINKTTAM